MDLRLALGSERPNLGSERSNLGSQRPNLRSERLNFGSGRPDFGSERPDFGSERPNLGLYGLDFRSGKPSLRLRGGTDRRTDRNWRKLDWRYWRYCDSASLGFTSFQLLKD